MLRRFAAFACLMSLVVGLGAAAVHDHLHLGSQAADPLADGCLHCAPVVEQEAVASLPPAPPPSAAPAVPAAPEPYLPSQLDPSHSGNAPPFSRAI